MVGVGCSATTDPGTGWALRTLEQGHTPGALATAVLETTGCVDHLGLLRACYTHPPTWLAELAVLVSRHADADPVAHGIAEEAVGLLTDLVRRLEPAPRLPVVVAGSVLTEPGPVSRGFTRWLGGLPNPVLRSGTGVVGALWIALRAHVRDDPGVHAHLIEQVRAR